MLNEPLHDPGDRVAVGVACALREGLVLREGLADMDDVAEAVAVALADGTLSPWKTHRASSLLHAKFGAQLDGGDCALTVHGGPSPAPATQPSTKSKPGAHTMLLCTAVDGTHAAAPEADDDTGLSW